MAVCLFIYLPIYLFIYLSRSQIVKGVRDALYEKVQKCSDLVIPFEKIQKIAEEIEIAMFGNFLNILFQYHVLTSSLSVATCVF